MFDELPIIASVSRLPQRLSETPAAVTVIDQAMIKASGMRTVEDLLRLVPGFQVTSHNQDSAIVTYHGLNSGMSNNEYGPRIQVLVDGRSMYSPLFKSGVNWNLLPVDLRNIDRIEVTRGPNTISYGSNAFMGVVNIITLDPALTHGWSMSTNLGNNGVQDASLRWGWGNEDTNLRATYKSFSDNGFTKAAYSGVWRDAMDDRSSRVFDLRVDKQLTAEDELRLDFTYANDVSLYGRPGSPLNDPLRNMRQSSAMLGLQWRHVISPTEEYRVRYAYSEERAAGPYMQQNSFSVVEPLLPSSVTFFAPNDNGGKSSSHELELEHRLSLFKNARAMWGLGLKNVALNSYSQFSDYQWRYRNNARLFGNLEYRPHDSWLLNAGISLERDSLSGNIADWRVGGNYHITPEHTIRILASRAHRTPSLYEFSGRVQKTDVSGTGYTNIEYLGRQAEPERIDSFELGYLAESKTWGASADVRLFFERIP
ncbi:MAG: TonB-dependent receptor, partial [Rhodocyclales bacterium]|nr:TonB-dependent receptor [Rhodocyclales bacterium]